MQEKIRRIFTQPDAPRTNTVNAELFEQSVESFFKVFNASPGGMCITDTSSSLVEVNQVYENFFGFSKEEVIGRTNEELCIIEKEDLARFRAIFKEKGELKNVEARCKDKYGRNLYCVITSVPIVLQNKQYMLTSFTDITRIKAQSIIITEQNKDIFDSVHYAKRIQEAVFPSKAFIENTLPESFVLLKPKAIVSGDFCWVEKSGDKIYVAAADCTGHGVPGALMSIVGFNLISKVPLENGDTKPSEILNEISRGIYKILRQHSAIDGVRDGMDISTIAINTKKGILEYAGARQPVYHIRGNELLRLVPDRFPIGIHAGRYLQEFNNHQVQIQKGDTIYLFTDGYSDQFGGPEKKKFKSIHFQKLLLAIQHLSMEEQKQALDQSIEEWKGEYEQIDDIMVIGIRI